MSNSNSKKPVRGRAPKDAGRKIKKKANVLSAEKVQYIDYKDVGLLQRFMSDRSKIRSQRLNGNTVQQQRELANAIKNAREMALLPYTKRVASVGRGPRGGRGPRVEGDVVESMENDVVDIQATDSDVEDMNATESLESGSTQDNEEA